MYSKFPLAIQEPFSRIVRPYNNAGRFNATVFISMLSGGRAGVSINLDSVRAEEPHSHVIYSMMSHLIANPVIVHCF